MKRMNAIQRTIWFAVFLSAAGACRSAFEAEAASSTDKAASKKQESTSPAPKSPFEREMMSIADVSEKAIPSVVNISTTKKRHPSQMQSPFMMDPFFRNFFEGMPGLRQQPRERLEQSLGSGVIIDANGTILTNNHVIDDSDEVVVTLHDKREYKAKIIGQDPPSDLAVLQLQDPPKDLRELPFGDSDAVRLGEVIVAIGNPFGVGQTVTMGIVSAKGRANVGIVDYEDFIQTDAAINPGNSGGALVNLRGELVGINSAILSRSGGYQGIGFAIPSNMAHSIMTSLIKDGKVVRGFLGVLIQDFTPELAKAMNVEVTEGVLISEVVQDSPADKAGLKAGDIVLKVDGHPVTTSGKLRNSIASMGAGRKAELEILRDGDHKTLTVELIEKKGDEVAGQNTPHVPLGGMNVESLSEALRQRFRISDRLREGAVIVDIQPGSPAAQIGLRPGDVIIGVDRQPVTSAGDFVQAYNRAGDKILLRIHRADGSMFVVLPKEP